MEDRYLFRGKRTDTGEWIIGSLLVDKQQDIETGEQIEIIGIYPSEYKDFAKKIDPFTICQCTGLKDKNGRVIWENDIVAYWDTYSTENGQAEADCIGTVVWDDETLSFQVTNRLSAESYEVLDGCSVVGNKFDNPELLEVQK